jgi:hypothetical protein
MGSLDWIERFLVEGTDILDLRAIRHLEQLYVRKIRFVRLESGRVVEIADVFRQCGWWSE